MNSIPIIFIILSCLSLSFIYYSKEFVIFCSEDYTINHLSTHSNGQHYYKLCNEVFNFEEKDNILSRILKQFNSAFLQIVPLNKNQKDFDKWYKNQKSDILNRLKMLKYAYVTLYLSLIFLIIIYSGTLLDKIVVRIISKLLLVVFFVFLFDFIIFSIFKMHLDIKWIDNVHAIIESIKDKSINFLKVQNLI